MLLVKQLLLVESQLTMVARNGGRLQSLRRRVEGASGEILAMSNILVIAIHVIYCFRHF